MDCRTVASDDAVMVVHAVGTPPEVVVTRFSPEGQPLGAPVNVGVSGLMGVTKAFGAGCVLPYNEAPYSRLLCFTSAGVTERALDADGLSFDNELVGSKDRVIIGGHKWVEATQQLERAIRAFDERGLVWTRPLRLMSTRSADGCVLATNPETLRSFLLDGSTGATLLEFDRVSAGEVTADWLFVTREEPEGGVLTCLSREDGSVRWSTSFKGRRFFARPPLVNGDRVLSFDAKGALVACSVETGDVLAQAAATDLTALFGVDGLPFVGVTTVRPKEYRFRLYAVR
ncbi:MAG: PQQ-binding-like beta-propeller repeat protein [Archangium sp.]|nr:PQQ-binding-like beta-propeller repeat protein [Archangium sp.]MDP3151086.1 PQQ-binding-like beta-propeller repeat protein [Archangium sp.]MDP3571770.1 PQQ-binding-like beta-propeller repeat protein [Archangium sp.]